MNCPICGSELQSELLHYSWYCPQKVESDKDKPFGWVSYSKYSHYHYYYGSKQIDIYVHPYRIITHVDSKTSDIYIYDGQFKFIIDFPELHPDTEEKLLQRIKNLLLLS